MIVLCSPSSVARPWINFEAGAAWMRGIPLIPICHGGLAPRNLPVPLSLRQGLSLSDVNCLSRLYSRVAAIAGCREPNRDFSKLAEGLLTSAEQVVPLTSAPPLLNRDEAIRARLMASLEHPDVRWRSPKALAAEAGITEELVADILLADPDVRFARNTRGATIIGLTRRVGQKKITKRPKK